MIFRNIAISLLMFMTVTGVTAKTPEDSTEVAETTFRPWIAVKTNLLYDAAMTPNIEVERWMGKNNGWSIMGEANFPWWQWHNKMRVYEVAEGSVELRRWLGRRHLQAGSKKRRPLTGHFLGLYAAGGYYDLEWDGKGEQGDFYSAGLAYGYSCRLSSHWNMEFSFAAGYIYSPYTHYDAMPNSDILIASYKKRLNYIGPTKLKVTLVWLIGKTKK